MTDLYIWGSVAIIALATAAIRFLPFIIWRGDKKTPKLIEKLGKMLPFAIMGMLVVYCLKDVSFASVPDFLPSLIACFVVGALYLWNRSTLISIVAGTACYMLLVQLFF